MMYDGPLPDVHDADAAPFWSAARESRLVLQRCARCHYLRNRPAPRCPQCLSRDSAWAELTGTGTVWSYAVYHRAMHPGFANAVPYTVALIELTEGATLTGTVLTSTGDADADGEVHIGTAVRAVFDPVTPEVSIVRWRPQR